MEEAVVAPAPAIMLPSLRGTMHDDSVCRGVWAITDADHDFPERTSDFEFKPTVTDPAAFPATGQYAGWFMLKMGNKLVKIEDKEMHVAFNKEDDVGGNYTVQGYGHNKFGRFALRGTLGADHRVQIYREYEARPAAVAPVKAQKKPSKRPAGDGGDGDGGEPPAKKRVGRPSMHVAVDAIDERLGGAGGGRTPRPPPHISKCHDVLWDIGSRPQATWFAKPVDHAKLGLHDYLSVVKQPMDLDTVKRNLERGVYKGPGEFAADMRLIFSNAVTYNPSAEHPINVAAMYLSERFEEKFRHMLVGLNKGVAYITSDSPRQPLAKALQHQHQQQLHSALAPVSTGRVPKLASKPPLRDAKAEAAARPPPGPGPRPPPDLVLGQGPSALLLKQQLATMEADLRALRAATDSGVNGRISSGECTSVPAPFSPTDPRGEERART